MSRLMPIIAKMIKNSRTITKRAVTAGIEIHNACIESFRFSFFEITRSGLKSLAILIILKTLMPSMILSIETVEITTITKSRIFAFYRR